MTLRWRLALILAVLAGAVGAGSAVASYLSTASQLHSTIDETLRSRAVAADAVNRSGDQHRPDGGADAVSGSTTCPLAGDLAPAAAAQIVGVDGSVTACIPGAPILPSPRADDSTDTEVSTVHIDATDYRVLSTPWRNGGTLQLASSLTTSDMLLGRLRVRLALLVAAVTAVAAALGWAVATWLVRPVVRLRDAAHRIATTLDLATPVDVNASGEVGSLASSFATMVTALGRARDQQRRLVSDASHEMRTPLTSLRSNVELIGRIEQLPQTERADVVAEVLADVDELAELLAELVDLASDLASAEPTEDVVLGDIARAVAARVERRLGRTVTVDDEAGVPVKGRPRQLERAIGNLVDNAVKYSDRGSPVIVEIRGRRVSVLDQGSGLSAGDADRIFDRFYRAVDVRTTPGSGLGLSIVDEIVRGHGGTVFAHNRQGGGAAIGFELASGGEPAERS